MVYPYSGIVFCLVKGLSSDMLQCSMGKEKKTDTKTHIFEEIFQSIETESTCY